ncbi:MAG: hypothetical protein C4K47_00875 [Candidatus Thorarchaeota archaeon]|nr:MAG: hypothetical protein C4K47_00875 [Candidatus Thorarchaeota archaeon]
MVAIDLLATLILLLLTAGASILLLSSSDRRLPRSCTRILRESAIVQERIDDFLRNGAREGCTDKHYLLREQMVYCPSHSFKGRFDQAIFRFDETPTLELLIERKFPTRHLLKKGRPEDFFQAALYSLALASKGVNCEPTLLLIIYCKQRDASDCARRLIPSECAACRKGRTFSRRYNPREVLKALRRLDEIWYEGRSPRASPAADKCAGCPHGKAGHCEYSAA